MPNLDYFGSILARTMELWQKEQHVEALRLLDDSIAKAEQNNEPSSPVQFLRMHASLIAGSLNDLPLVKRYCEEVLLREPQNALAMYTLADALLRQGEVDLAARQAACAYALVFNSSDAKDRDLLELLMKRWPEMRGEFKKVD